MIKLNNFLLKAGLLLFLTVILISCSQEEQGEIHIYLVGDSTMANKADPEHNPERGWGMEFHRVFNDQVKIFNHAVNGRSSKSFIEEGRWDSVMNDLKYGDYVFIQFGHNDQKYKDSRRYTNPYSGYRQNLVKYILDTRSKGANPIICSSIVRRNFNEYGTLEDTHGAYPFVARMVAREYNVPFLDLQQKTEDWINKLGQEESKQYFMNLEPGQYEIFPDGRVDNTHLVEAGAFAVSVFAAEEMIKEDVPLSKYIRQGLFHE